MLMRIADLSGSGGGGGGGAGAGSATGSGVGSGAGAGSGGVAHAASSARHAQLTSMRWLVTEADAQDVDLRRAQATAQHVQLVEVVGGADIDAVVVRPRISGLATIDAAADLQVFLASHHDDWDVSTPTRVTVALNGVEPGSHYRVYQTMVAHNAGNAYTVWNALGRPPRPDRDQQTQLRAASGLRREAIADVAFRLAPLDARDASEMMRELQGYRIFEAFRGEPPIDEPALCEILIATGRLLIEHPDIHEVDINPLVFEGARPVAVDALITLDTTPDESSANGRKG